MNREEAYAYLEGHQVISASDAQEVCKAFGVDFDHKVHVIWESRKDAYDRYGMWANVDAPGIAVFGLDLSYCVCEQLGLGRPGRGFTGKGFQTQANEKAIRAYFAAKENE
jgi:hypothetical protein